MLTKAYGSICLRFATLTFLLVSTLSATLGHAGPRDQAERIFQRLNGVPPTATVLDRMEALVLEGKYREAALVAIDEADGHFYNTKLRNWWTPLTNENDNARAQLNDYTALIIGMTRDEVPFDQVLSADLIYTATGPEDNPLPDYSLRNNEHFEEVAERNLRLDLALVGKKQSELTPLAPDVAAGALTTWGFAKDFYNAGTNRAATRFSLMTFLCRDLENLTDPTRPDFRIRRDVDRAPGNDSTVFRNKCAGCHTGMDAITGAFAFVDYTADDGLIYDPTQVVEKVNRNSDVFPAGYVTTDDSWIVLWAEGPNAELGWNGPTSGKGKKSWGQMLTATDAFASCMAERVLVEVCTVDPEEDNVKNAINQLAASFKSQQGKSKYNLKYLFAQSAVVCRGN